jgi:hypothetical protein
MGMAAITNRRRATGWTALVFAVLALVLWAFVAFMALVGAASEDEAPAPPPVSELPLPSGWSVQSDHACVGSHCSERDFTVVHESGTSADDPCDAWGAAFEAAGWRVVEQCAAASEASGEPLSLGAERDQLRAWVGLTSSAQANGVMNFQSDEAGKRYYEERFALPIDPAWIAVFLTIGSLVAGIAWMRLRRSGMSDRSVGSSG